MSSRTFRDKIKKQDDDDLTKGKLPKDFTDAHPVTLTEAHALLQKRNMDVKLLGVPEMKMDNAVVSGCRNYIEAQQDRFEGESYLAIAHKKTEIRTNYENVINEVEMIQLLNLRPRDTEEAKVLVTSLEKLSNDEDLRYLAEIIVIINRDSAVEQE